MEPLLVSADTITKSNGGELMRLETKQDFQTWMHKLLEPLKPLYSKGGARLHLGDTGVTYPQVSIEMEAFSRPLWALVPFWAGGGRDKELRIFIEKGCQMAQTLIVKNTGADLQIMTRDLWRWRPLQAELFLHQSKYGTL